jgi:predicted amidohydrolase
MTNIMELDRDRLRAALQPEDADHGVTQFRFLARELGIWLHIGSLALLGEGGKPINRSLLISPEGRIAARYDKIHMFDVDLPGGETYRESANYQAGREAVVATLPWGQLGMTICYDLRFPHLYRALAQAGARFLAVPAAFTKPTGTAHWHTLLRARAIECQCYVFAAAQGGRHENGRDTFGHSLVISPWGEILAEAAIQPAVTFADVELQRLEDVRTQVPSLRHDRPFDVVYAADAPPDEVAS